MVRPNAFDVHRRRRSTQLLLLLFRCGFDERYDRRYKSLGTSATHTIMLMLYLF